MNLIKSDFHNCFHKVSCYPEKRRYKFVIPIRNVFRSKSLSSYLLSKINDDVFRKAYFTKF